MREKLLTLFIQAFKFGIVGVISTILDFGLLYIFKSIFGIQYLIAAALSFLLSLIFNYICSMMFVFEGKKDTSKTKEFLVFGILSLMGLGINEWILWLLHGKLGMDVMLAKLPATAVVMVWNFVTRKIFVEDHSENK